MLKWDLNDDMRAEPDLIHNVLNPLLRSEIYPASLFNLQSITQVVDEHYHRSGKHENILSLLISWGLAVKFLLCQDSSDMLDTSYQP
jgi:hypothetical protein